MDFISNYQEISSNVIPAVPRQIAVMQGWSRRLRQRMEEKNWTGRDLARASKVDYENIAKYLKGAVAAPRGETLTKLAKAVDRDLKWLLHGDEAHVGNTADIPPEANPEIVEVPVYLLEIPAGPGAWVEDDPEPAETQPFKLSRLRSLTRAPLDKLAMAQVYGDSMQPTLFNADMVLVDTTQRSPRDGLFVVRLFGELMVKRITTGPGQVDVSSDNTAHRSYPNVDLDQLHIVGRVIWLGRRM
jgi:phage repressor protein C with HTH and peptisase S24 domain